MGLHVPPSAQIALNVDWCVRISKINVREMGEECGIPKGKFRIMLNNCCIAKKYWPAVAAYLDEEIEDLINPNFIRMQEGVCA